MTLVLIGMVVIGVALLRGQHPTHVGLGPAQLNVDFAAAADSGLSKEEIEQEQSAMRDRIAKLEAEASGSQVGSPSVDLTGQWMGANGLTYVIQQTGGQAVIQEWSGGLVAAVGQGPVSGVQAHFQAQAVNGVSTAVDLTLGGPNTSARAFRGCCRSCASAVAWVGDRQRPWRRAPHLC